MSARSKSEATLGIGISVAAAIAACSIMQFGAPATASSTAAAAALYLVPALLFAAAAILGSRVPGLYIGATVGFSVAMVAETYVEKFLTPNNSMPGAGFLFFVFPLALLALAVVCAVLGRVGSRRSVLNAGTVFLAVSGLWLYHLLSSASKGAA